MLTSPSTSLPRRNDGIDLLRGLSILLVVVHHLALRFRLPLRPSVGDWLPKRLIDAVSFNGYESVFVFFVISGFVITRRVMDREGALGTMDWRRFYAQRAQRIVPLLLVLLSVLALLHLLRVPQFVIDSPRQSLGGALLSALTMTLNWYEGRTEAWLPGAWDVLWSLSIEEVFYLAFPLLCLGLRGRWRVLALAALALSLPWTRAALHAHEIWQEKAYLPGMSAIALGVLAAVLSRRWAPPRRTARYLAALGIVAVCAVLVYGDFLWRLMHDSVMLLLCAGAACWLIAAAGSTRRVPRGLRWLTEMGRCSYEIYLSHMFVVLPATGLYRLALGDDLQWTACVYPPAVLLCAAIGRWINGYSPLSGCWQRSASDQPSTDSGWRTSRPWARSTSQ